MGLVKILRSIFGNKLEDRYPSPRYLIERWDNSCGGTNGQYDDYGYRVIDTHTNQVVDSESHSGKCDNR